MSLQFTATVVLSIVCLAAPAYTDFQTLLPGTDAYLREWRPLAEQGDAAAQYTFGWLYDNGQGVPQDYGQARQWFEKVANRGLASDQSSMGTTYLNGQGVCQRIISRHCDGFIWPQIKEML